MVTRIGKREEIVQLYFLFRSNCLYLFHKFKSYWENIIIDMWALVSVTYNIYLFSFAKLQQYLPDSEKLENISFTVGKLSLFFSLHGCWNWLRHLCKSKKSQVKYKNDLFRNNFT